MPEPERNQKNGHAERAKKNSVEFIVSFLIWSGPRFYFGAGCAVGGKIPLSRR